LQNLTVFAELQYLKAGFGFASDLVKKFKTFFGTTAFDINVINTYCTSQSHTASHSFHNAGNWLRILCPGDGLSCCIT